MSFKQSIYFLVSLESLFDLLLRYVRSDEYIDISFTGRGFVSFNQTLHLILLVLIESIDFLLLLDLIL